MSINCHRQLFFRARENGRDNARDSIRCKFFAGKCIAHCCIPKQSISVIVVLLPAFAGLACATN